MGTEVMHIAVYCRRRGQTGMGMVAFLGQLEKQEVAAAIIIIIITILFFYHAKIVLLYLSTHYKIREEHSLKYIENGKYIIKIAEIQCLVVHNH